MATKTFLYNLDLNFNELINSKFQILATDPAVPLQGQFWYNSTSNRFKYYDGTSTQEVANLNDIVGLLNYKGGYDAATNTPDLDTTPAAGTIKKGDVYTVTVAGNFFTEPVSPGDMIIAEIDDPAALSDFTVVEQNLNPATETVAGYIRIATQAETDAGTNDSIAITPLKLATYIASQGFTRKFAVDLDSTDPAVTRVVAGGQTTFTVTHNLGTDDANVSVRRISNGREVAISVEFPTANTIDVIGNGNIADGVYKVTIVG